MTALLVVIGGAVGAPLRYLVDQWVTSRHRSAFPWGTFTVNVVGSLLLGLLAGASAAGALPDWVLTVAGTGFCGALTTFSTFGYQTAHLLEGEDWIPALLNVVGSFAAGLTAVAVGWWAGGLLG